MSGTGDLRAVLADSLPAHAEYLATPILAALAAADEPLVAEVECPECGGAACDADPHPVTGEPINQRPCPHPSCIDGTVRGGWFTEDVLRARLRDVFWEGARIVNVDELLDAVVRALFGEGS